LDIKTTFLYGELKKGIYMHQLEGFIAQDKECHVCLLKKLLYGLKYSLRQWYKWFDIFMLGYGYSRNDYNNCVCFRKPLNGLFVYLLYVKNMLIIFKNMSEINILKDQ
jgi:hypothetical protein